MAKDWIGITHETVTAAPGVDWNQLKPDVLALLLDHFSANMPLFFPGSAAAISVPAEDEAFADDPADADIIVQIKELIETRVRPAVANDGGDIVYRGFDKGKVYLKMQGACSGCPSSIATLKNGIEQLLKYYVPEVTEVRANPRNLEVHATVEPFVDFSALDLVGVVVPSGTHGRRVISKAGGSS